MVAQFSTGILAHFSISIYTTNVSRYTSNPSIDDTLTDPKQPVPFKNEPVYKTSKALENNVFSGAFIVHVSRNEFDTPFTFVGE